MGNPPSAEPLTDEQIEELRGILQATREELEAALDASREDVRPVGVDEPIGRLTRMDALQQQSMAKASRRGAEARLQRIVVALAAVDEGDYGFCASCDEPIGYTRLKARPETHLCLICQERVESRRA